MRQTPRHHVHAVPDRARSATIPAATVRQDEQLDWLVECGVLATTPGPRTCMEQAAVRDRQTFAKRSARSARGEVM